jgi:hypothetical protein
MPSQAAIRAKANLENTPPRATLAAKHASAQFGARLVSVTNQIRAASRRRRARTNGTQPFPRYAVEQLKTRRRTPVPQPENIRFSFPAATPTAPEMDVDMHEASAPVATTSVSLPRHLMRPAFKAIQPDAILAASPDLADTPTPYVQEKLRELGPS